MKYLVALNFARPDLLGAPPSGWLAGANQTCLLKALRYNP
jgi:hypothetical protein